MATVRKWKLEMPSSVTIHKAHVRRGVKPREDDEQCLLFGSDERPGILSVMQAKYPDLAWLFHCPNQGMGSVRLGSQRKAMGVKPGVWDISYDGPSVWFTPKGLIDPPNQLTLRLRYDRLRIEMKAGTAGLSDDQVRWAWYYEGLPGKSRLAVCYSALDAWEVIREYFGIPYEEGLYEAYRLLS